jgi:predicted extracellular nuclease
MNKGLLRIFSLILILALMVVALPAQNTRAISNTVVISQVYGGGGNSGAPLTNDYIELFNRGTSTVSLAGWSVQYASATGTGNFGGNSYQITDLSGSLAAGQYMLVEESSGSSCSGSPCGSPLPAPDVTDASPINMSASGGKVALVNSTTPLGCNGGSTPCSPAALATIVDLVGWGSANFYEGSAAAPATSNTTAAFRASGGCLDTDDNSADFSTAAPSPSNTASPLHSCAGPTNPTGTGAADPDLVAIGESTLLTVTVTPGENPPSTGLTVSCDLSTIGGSATQAFSDDGDGTFSFTATPNSDTSVSSNNFSCTIADAEARTGSASISLDVIVPIGTVQGSVGDTDDGFNFASPLAGQTATVQGVIYENTLARTSSGGNSHTFFIQNTAATADSDPNSSDGVYVYIGYYSTLRVKGGGYYAPKVGDEVVLQGPVQEYYGQTEISNPYVLSVVNHNVDIPAFVANPPSNLQDAYRYWERREGMRGQVPADSLVLNGRNVFASTADAEVWVARPDSTIAQRIDPYTRRAFRDAHPLDDNYNPNIWDGNGYRILMGSLGIKAAVGNNTAMINPARTFDTVNGSPTGGVYFDFGKYSIQPDQQVNFSDGVDPAANNPPTTFNRTQEYSIVDYNLENLYDYRDDPFSGCDFANVPAGSNPGCSNAGTPFLTSIKPPYDYVPADESAYQARLNDIALQIINDLHSPDILMVQEVENQDICKITDGAMDCGTTNNADGQPDDLQDLALKIDSLGGPTYAAAFDRDSSDLRGIVPAFMYRTDRVQLLSPGDDPLLGGLPAIDYAGAAASFNSDVSNPKTLNATSLADTTGCETTMVFPRAPDIGLFRIWRDGIGSSVFTDVYVVNNHFKSGPDSCVAPRTEQAKYNAAIVSFLQDAKPNARIVVGGDLNVYPRPDDPFAPIGQSGSSDQLGALYDSSLGLTNLWDVLLGQVPESAYSYVYQGQAQTLDQIFTNQSMLSDLEQIRSAHINSDFPADYPGDVARGTSDHDPQLASFSDLPTIDRLEELVRYYDANGMITGNNTTSILLDRLEKASRFQQNGQKDAYMSQLQAFIDQIYDFTPQFITQEAADALVNETTLLQSLP